MAASKAPPHAKKQSRRILGILLGLVVLGGVISLALRSGKKEGPKEDFVIVDLAPPPPPPPPPPPQEEPPPEPDEEMDEPTEISEADAPDDISEDQGESIDLGIDAGDLTAGPGGGGFLVNIGRGGRGSGGGQGAGMLEDVDSPPTPISKIQPTYPSSLLKKGTGGRVVVSCVVDDSGKVVSTSIKQSAHPDLDKAAIAAVNKWKFKPASKAGRSVTAKCLVPFNFEVKNS
jgi:protein TonB